MQRGARCCVDISTGGRRGWVENVQGSNNGAWGSKEKPTRNNGVCRFVAESRGTGV